MLLPDSEEIALDPVSFPETWLDQSIEPLKPQANPIDFPAQPNAIDSTGMVISVEESPVSDPEVVSLNRDCSIEEEDLEGLISDISAK